MRKYFLALFFTYATANATDIYFQPNNIPLSFSRNNGASLTTGLTVTVKVINTLTGATLLASTSCPEVGAPSGIYTYNWAPSVASDTYAEAIYTVGSQIYTEFFIISFDLSGGRSN